ncbi:MAG: hypothetical protein Q9170_002575, partial [Blastenia crenularia]
VIVQYSMPEGFESIALTCKQIHATCRPFLDIHNSRSSQFDTFAYTGDRHGWIYNLRTAYQLIIPIAVEPIIARHIRHADFAHDSRFTRCIPHDLLFDDNYEADVRQLLATSPYLQQCGLDWHDFYARIREETQTPNYSQHAAAFLMTLLPNLESLVLPRRWVSCDATSPLVHAIVHQANQLDNPNKRPSLAQVTKIELNISTVARDFMDLEFAIPFLALPRVQSFCGVSCVAFGDDSRIGVPAGRFNDIFGQTLTSINLVACCIDDVGIAHLLQHAARLRTLRFSYATKTHSGPQEWDICKFIDAIERQVGSHLEELSIVFHDLHDSIPRGTTSMLGFQWLQKLELPLEVAASTINGAAATAHRTKIPVNEATDLRESFRDDEVPYISYLVPASVRQLSLTSDGGAEHANVLDLTFRRFATWKASTLPALWAIQLSCPDEADKEYKEQCTKLLTLCDKAGVILRLKRFSSSFNTDWLE